MNSYEPSSPRVALGLIAIAMAAITMTALVVLPATLDSVSADSPTLAATKPAPQISNDVAVSPARGATPKPDNREARVHTGHPTFGTPEFAGNRHLLSSRSRTTF
jgi:hypothetical protein